MMCGRKLRSMRHAELHSPCQVVVSATASQLVHRDKQARLTTSELNTYPFRQLLSSSGRPGRAHGCCGLPCGSWQVESKVSLEEMPIVAFLPRATSSFGRHVTLLTNCSSHAPVAHWLNSFAHATIHAKSPPLLLARFNRID